MLVIVDEIISPYVNKNEQGGISAVNDKSRNTTIWLRAQLNKKLCIYDDLHEHIDLAKKHTRETSEVFSVGLITLGINQMGKSNGADEIVLKFKYRDRKTN